MLSDQERALLKRKIDEIGFGPAAKRYGVSREVLAKAVANIEVEPKTLHWLQMKLAESEFEP